MRTEIPGYSLNERILDRERTIIYRGERKEDGQTVIIKVCRREFPSEKIRSRFRREFELPTRLQDVSGVISVHHLEDTQRHLALVMEDFRAVSLKDYLRDRECSIEEFISLALSLVDTLEKMHDAGVIHKDIKPANILYHSPSHTLKITDFGVASLLTRENPTLKGHRLLEGTLPYVSPEQTGWMNRSLDYRTDYYSLGASFYEILAGRPPFVADDPLEYIHCHIARRPPSLRKFRPQIPLYLEEIIMKLLAKGAEDRYQSARGLREDLKKAKQWWKEGREGSFELGQEDFSPHFQIPSRLYGREEEIEALEEAFSRVRDGNFEVAFVAGEAGIGKSALVQELHRSLAGKGFFASGKYEQFHRDLPYRALRQALEEVAGQILAGGEEELQERKEILLDNLGQNSQLVIDLAPGFEAFLGPQPPPPPLEGEEAKIRFFETLTELLRTLATEDSPVVIFLDDLQWADHSSYELLDYLLDREIPHLLFLGAYRDEEIAPQSFQTQLIQKVENQKGLFLKLTTLTLDDQAKMMEDTLGCSPNKANELASLVNEKTHGNPFFVRAFLKSLYDRDLLNFSREKKEWTWSEEALREEKMTENVLAFLSQKLETINPACKEALGLAACIGNHFDFSTLKLAWREKEEELIQALLEALREDLLLAREGRLVIDGREIPGLPPRFSFIHDKVQQAAEQILPPERKKEVHHHLGRELQNQSPQGENIFEIVRHLNLSGDLLDTEEKRLEVARLNLKAAEKALNSYAFGGALNFLNEARELLPDQRWENYPDLTRDIELFRAQSLSALARYQKALELFDLLLEKVDDLLLRSQIYRNLISIHCHMTKERESITIALEGLKELDISFSSTGTLAFLWQFLKLKWRLRKKSTDELRRLPRTQNPRIIATQHLLADFYLPLTNTSHPLQPFVSLKMMELNLKWGNTRYSALGYVMYGVTLVIAQADYERGYEYGKLALEVTKDFTGRKIDSVVGTAMGVFLNHWKLNFGECEEFLLQSYSYARDRSEINYAIYSLLQSCAILLISGAPLPEIWKRGQEVISESEEHKNENALFSMYTLQQMILYLEGDEEKIKEFAAQHGEGEKIFDTYAKNPDHMVVYSYHIFTTISQSIMNNYHQAYESSQNLYDFAPFPAYPLGSEVFFWEGIAILNLLEEATWGKKRKLKKRLKYIEKYLRDISKTNPPNFLRKHLLFQGEKAKVEDRTDEAIKLFTQARQESQKEGSLLHSGVAAEKTAEFYLSLGDQKSARLHLEEALYYYRQWGASAKTAQLRKKFSTLLEGQDSEEKEGQPLWEETFGTTLVRSTFWEAHSVFKAARVMSEELERDKLLGKILQMCLEFAGAERAFLIEKTEAGFNILARQETEGKPQVFQTGELPLEEVDNLSQSALQFVERTGTPLVLEEAKEDERFRNDPHIIKKEVKSLLCLPLKKDEVFAGLLYVENNLVSGAFTSDRLEGLQILAGQAAVSLANARLFHNLELTNLKLKREIKEKKKAQKELLSASEQEQQRIAQDLHDDLGQRLTAIKFGIEALEKTWEKGLDPGVEDFQEMAAMVRDSVKQTRLLARRLYPIALARGMEPALRDLLKSLERQDLSWEIKGNWEEIGLDQEEASHLYRIIQEAASNGAKYGQGSWIKVLLQEREEGWEAAVVNDGATFDPKAVKSGMGLTSMRYRAGLMGGKLEIEPRKGGGTRVICRWKEGE